MPAKRQDVDDYFAGDSLTLNVTVLDGSGSARDITGADIEYIIKDDNQSGVLVQKTRAGGSITITDGAAGEFDISIDPADTQSLRGEYYHECEVTLQDGTTATVFHGDMSVKDSKID